MGLDLEFESKQGGMLQRMQLISIFCLLKIGETRLMVVAMKEPFQEDLDLAHPKKTPKVLSPVLEIFSFEIEFPLIWVQERCGENQNEINRV